MTGTLSGAKKAEFRDSAIAREGFAMQGSNVGPSFNANIRTVKDASADHRRGGEVRVLLSPKTVGSTSGFMGVASIGPGEKISEHYHPYSEEFVYVVRGTLTVRLDGVLYLLEAQQAVLIPQNVRHRLMNEGQEEVFIVFHIGPLAPKPELGHVDTE
jgi:putative monooxygenase